MFTKNIQTDWRRIATTTRTRAHAEQNLEHKRTPSVAGNAVLHPFYREPHAQCSWPRQLTPVSISSCVHALRSNAVTASLSLHSQHKLICNAPKPVYHQYDKSVGKGLHLHHQKQLQLTPLAANFCRKAHDKHVHQPRFSTSSHKH